MKSPFYDELVSLGAHWPADASRGPDHFGDPAAEYDAARRAAAVADRSFASKIELGGPDRVRLLHNLCTNDIKGLPPGRGCEAFVTNVQGKILAHVRVFAEAQSLWLDTVPGAAPALLAHFNRYVIMEKVELADRTGEFAQLLVVGPAAKRVVAAAAQRDVPELSDLEHVAVSLAGHACRLMNNDSLGLPAIELRLAAGNARPVWQAVWHAGQPLGLRAMGERAYETLRVEAGLPDYGVDIDDSNLPQEVGRDRRDISFTKGCYLGQETVARIDALGHVNRHLVGLAIPGQRAVPPAGSAISAADKVAGKVTSAVFSPALDCPIALGYVRRGLEKPGTEVVIDSAGTPVPASVRALPFR
jgi:folate-binding protein YgfZ